MQLDQHISANIRSKIEEAYYAKVNHQARLEQLIHDPTFMQRPEVHVAVFSDHGVVHVRDVARQILDVLDKAHGVLIPTRSASRMAMMEEYGVLVAYLHDIGMFDFSSFGRAMHSEYAAQSVFRPDLDEIVDEVWRENGGKLSWRLSQLAEQGILAQDPRLTLREMLAMSVCHSKSKVPMAVLNDPDRLRAAMLDIVGTNLQMLHTREQKAGLAAQATDGMAPLGEGVNPSVLRHYSDFEDEAYQWLVAPHPALHELVQDVIDTLRALRCADALRQRGTVLRTSGGYEIFMNQNTGKAVCAFGLASGHTFLLEVSNQVSAGEANIAASELDHACDLRISFHRGMFASPEAVEFAVTCAAGVVYDIQNDCITSFLRPPGEAPISGLKPANQMQLLLEETDDNLAFTTLVRERIIALDPGLETQVRITPSLEHASDRERTLYLAAPALDWTLAQKQTLLDHVGASGHRVEEIDWETAFLDVKQVALQAGDVLLEAGAPAAFVYIPLGPGLRIVPLGGYEELGAPPWLPLGVTGVIRGATRNATIHAKQPVNLLMIPKSVYLTHWHYLHTLQSYLEAVGRAMARSEN